MRKKFLAVLIMTAMLCQLIAFMPVSADETLSDNYVFKEDFDGESHSLTTTSWLDCGIVTDGRGERVLKVTNPGSGQETSGIVEIPSIQMPEDSEVQVFSVDMMFEQYDLSGRFKVCFEDTNRYSMLNVTPDGYIILASGQRYENDGNGVAFKYETGQWYTLSIVVNNRTHEVELFVNGKCIGMVSARNEMTPGVRRVMWESCSGTEGVGNTVYLDNLVVGTDPDVIVPVTVDECEVEIVCEELGQAFWSKSVDFGIKVKNNTDTKKTYEIKTELVSDLQITEYTKLDTVELEAGESTVINHQATLLRYAVYDVNVEITEASNTYTYNTEVVTIKKSEKQNPQFGIIDHAADQMYGLGRYDEKFRFLKNAGISGLRFALYWNDYELEEKVYKMPSWYKDVYASMVENNLSLYCLIGNNNSRGFYGDERPPKSPSVVEAAGVYANKVVEDILKTGVEVEGYEIYNEWNVMNPGDDVPSAFNRDNLPPEDYVTLVKAQYPQIKAADPDAVIDGLSGMTWNRTDLFKDFATRMFAAGLNDYSDGYSIHTYYGAANSPDTGLHYAGIEWLKNLMKENNAEDKGIRISEMGWQAIHSSSAEIAKWVVKYAAMVHDEVDKVYWYTAQRKKETTYGAGEQSYGWMQDEVRGQDYVPYAPLEQMRAASNYNSYVADARSKEKIELEDNKVVMYRFEKADGTDVIMAWVKDDSWWPTRSLTLNLDAEYAIVSDLYGNETEYELNDGAFELTITKEPQYITGGFSNTTGDEKLSVSVMNTEGKVYVMGNIGLKNENLTFLVKKDNEICYVNQIKSDADGNYTLMFPLNKEYGVYNLTVGTEDNGKTPISFAFDIKAFDIEVLKDGQAIDSANVLKSGDKLAIKAAKNIETSDASVIVAQYGTVGNLVDVRIETYKEDTPMEVEVKQDNVDIRVYVWSMTDIVPLNNVVTLERDKK